MPSWEIPCVVDGSSVTFRVSAYGNVLSVEPSTSPFANMSPLDVFGFDDADAMLLGEPPRILVEDALSNGLNVRGLSVVFRTSMVFVSVAVVAEPIRLVMGAAEGEAVLNLDAGDDLPSRAEAFQARTDGAQAVDDLPVTLTVRQVQKIAAIADAVVNGHAGYERPLADAVWFLQNAALKAWGQPQEHVDLAELWAAIDANPWPPSGRPKPQPE